MSIQYYYPITGTTTSSVTLKNPDKGDSETLNINTKTHITMNKKIFTYNKSVNYRLLMTFSNLTKTELDNLITFYTDNVGSTFGYRDVLNRVWSVSFLNDPFESTIKSGQADCRMGDVTIQLMATPYSVATRIYLVDSNGNYLVDNAGNKLFTINYLQ